MLLLAGEDVHLRVYSVPGGRLLGSLRVFETQPIHGIRAVATASSEGSSEDVRVGCGGGAGGGGPILVWGGNDLALVSADAVGDACEFSPVGKACDGQEHGCGGQGKKLHIVRGRAPDRIYDGTLIHSSAAKDGSDVRFVVVTAHNELVCGRRCDDEYFLVLGPPCSPARPILYCARLFVPPEQPSMVIVAAGTVFGEILVWRCRFDGGDDGQPRIEMLAVLSGHEGSVFGLDVIRHSPDRLLLASCSDDRTIRIWNVSDGDSGSERAGGSEVVYDTAARETGFGRPSEPSSEILVSRAARPWAQAALTMAHASRIWCVRFGRKIYGDGSEVLAPDQIHLYSFGEDATVQEWMVRLQPKGQETAVDGSAADVEGVVSPIRPGGGHTRHLHEGKHIWATAMIHRHEGDLIATGGADGRICLLEPEVGNIVQTQGGRSSEISLLLSWDDIARDLQRQPGDALPESDMAVGGGSRSKAKHDTVNRFAFVSEGELILITTNGRALLGRLADGDARAHWSEIAVPGDIDFAYSALRPVGSGAVLLGTTTGRLLAYVDGIFHAVVGADFDGKISDIFLLRREHQRNVSSSDIWSVLVTIVGSPTAYLLNLDLDKRAVQDNALAVNVGREFLTTTAAYIGCEIFLGSRAGCIAVICVAHVRETPPTIASHSIKQLYEIPKEDAITSLCEVPGNNKPALQRYLLATSRDGYYRILRLCFSSAHSSAHMAVTSTTSLELVHAGGTLINSNFIESATILPPPTDPSDGHSRRDDRNILVVMQGFRSTRFVVWLEWPHPVRRVLWEVECGGSHRQWTVAFGPGAVTSMPGQGLASLPVAVSLACTRAGNLQVAKRRLWQPARDGDGTGRGGQLVDGVVVLPRTTAGEGVHGREIRAVAVVHPPQLTDGGTAGLTYVATGGEDTKIKLWAYYHGHFGGGDRSATRKPPEMRCLTVIEKHTAGLQAIKWHRSATNGQLRLFSSAGVEEFFVWRVRRLEGSAFDLVDDEEMGSGGLLTGGMLGVVCESVFGDKSEGGDLRIMDFDILDERNDELEGYRRIVEDVDGIDVSDRLQPLIISMAFSNSSFKVYHYSQAISPPNKQHEEVYKGTFALLAEGRYTGACLTQIRHLRLDGTDYWLTASTDGHVVLWTTDGLVTDIDGHSSSLLAEKKRNLTPIHASRIHQNAIKALDIRTGPAVPGTSNYGGAMSMPLTVVTGGDDNAIGVLRLVVRIRREQMAKNTQVVVVSKSIVRSAHAAAVSALKIVHSQPQPRDAAGRQQENDNLVVLSTGNDQRLRRWRVLDHASNPRARKRIELLEDRASAVADAGALELMGAGAGGGRIIIGGVGLEVWSLV